jgi:predicted transcriptional regulator
MITINQIWRYLRGRALTAAALSELLNRDPEDVNQALETLKAARIVKETKGTWSLVDDEARPTDLRDKLVLSTVVKAKSVTREDLTPQIPGSTSAQVYTSLRRLTLTGLVSKVKNGSRTPVYQPA